MQSAILPEPKHNGLHLPHKGDTTRWSGPTRWRLRYSRTQLSALLSSAPPRQLMSHSASRKTSLCGAHIIIDRLYMCLMQSSISNLALATSAQHSKKICQCVALRGNCTAKQISLLMLTKPPSTITIPKSTLSSTDHGLETTANELQSDCQFLSTVANTSSPCIATTNKRTRSIFAHG
jgi:hypothetical protein